MLQTGLDVLLESQLNQLDHQRVGVVSHPAAVDRFLQDSATLLIRAGVKVTALLGPEHGYYGMVADGDAIANTTDKRTGLPVYSLYGKTKEPTPDMLQGVDVLLFDMQDVGVRYYTYLSTLVHLMRGAARVGLPVIVLDRPNPINGIQREGPLVNPGFESFIGILPVPMRHGLTLGELALMANHRLNIRCDLSVIPMRGWRREMWFDGLERNWVPTSPNIPHFDTTLPYVGTCLVEGTNLSEGRGTALPFEVVGAPWVDGFALADRLNRLNLPGVIFRPYAFIPSASKHAGKHCQGVQLHITDRQAFRPVYTGLHLLAVCRQLHPNEFQFLTSSWEGKPAHFDLLMGSALPRTQLLANTPADEIVQAWPEVISQFEAGLQDFILYQ